MGRRRDIGLPGRRGIIALDTDDDKGHCPGMRVLARLVVITLLVPLGVLAEPAAPRHHWYKDWKNWALIAGSVAASAYATHELHRCRSRTDLENCPEGGYGPFRAREFVRLDASLGMAALAVYGREHWHGAWINDAPVIAWAGYNVAVGVRDERVPARGLSPSRLSIPQAQPLRSR